MKKKNLFLICIFIAILSIICIWPSRTNHQYVVEKQKKLSLIEEIDTNCPVKLLNVTHKCLKRLRELNEYESDEPDGTIYYHTYWNLGRGPQPELRYRIVKLNIRSFLATQNLKYSKLIVWLAHGSDNNLKKQLNDQFKNFIDKNIFEIKEVNYENLCLNGAFGQNYKTCVSTRSDDIAISDFIRFLVLYEYGGIYTDGDVIYLRDMRPFLNLNFVYRWSFTLEYNTAIMGLKKKRNKLIEEFYSDVIFSNQNLASAFHPHSIQRLIYSKTNGNSFNNSFFKVFHSDVFDPGWLCDDGVSKFQSSHPCSFQDFFDKEILASDFNFNNFYGGAFTYHLHMGECGSCKVKENSYFYQIEKYFDRIIEKKINFL